MKKLARMVFLVAIACSMFGFVPTAWAYAACSDTYSQDGTQCGSHCDYYDDNDRWIGSIDIDYQC